MSSGSKPTPPKLAARAGPWGALHPRRFRIRMEPKRKPITENFGVESNQGIPEQTMVVILAAGKGTRMGLADLVKVRFEIDGVPAIDRLIDAFKRARFRRSCWWLALMPAARRRSTKWSTSPARCRASPDAAVGGRRAGRLHHDPGPPQSLASRTPDWPPRYYRRHGLEPAAIPCITIEGAGLAEF